MFFVLLIMSRALFSENKKLTELAQKTYEVFLCSFTNENEQELADFVIQPMFKEFRIKLSRAFKQKKLHDQKKVAKDVIVFADALKTIFKNTNQLIKDVQSRSGAADFDTNRVAFAEVSNMLYFGRLKELNLQHVILLMLTDLTQTEREIDVLTTDISQACWKAFLAAENGSPLAAVEVLDKELGVLKKTGLMKQLYEDYKLVGKEFESFWSKAKSENYQKANESLVRVIFFLQLLELKLTQQGNLTHMDKVTNADDIVLVQSGNCDIVERMLEQLDFPVTAPILFLIRSWKLKR